MISFKKQDFKNNIKNLRGWSTDRKIVVFAVDDYGNVRLDSRSAREKIDACGYTSHDRFDEYDALENKEDLEQLFSALTSVSDINGRHAIFTPFAVSCNLNFEKISEDDFEKIHYETLPETFLKLESYYPKDYEGVWKLWQEGISKKLLAPEFHGKEHFNSKILLEKLEAKDLELLTVLNNRSFVGIHNTGYKTILPSATYDFWELSENKPFEHNIKDGLNNFLQIFGYKAVHFNPPGGREHNSIHKVLNENGIRYIDTPLIKYEHQGLGRYKYILNYTGKKNSLGMTLIVRNVIFEPTHNIGVDWVSYSLKQIEAAFRWKRPAIVSSHRVNFCGHIDSGNRNIGINALRKLLNKIVEKWPDVEFLSSKELGQLIEK